MIAQPIKLDLTKLSSLSSSHKQGRQAGWVEHDPTEILESVQVCFTKVIDKATADGHHIDSGLKAIGITNQRETTVIWSKSTGRPLYNAIVWMDVRTSSICCALKLLWLLENVDAVKEAVKTGDAPVWDNRYLVNLELNRRCGKWFTCHRCL
ncbi:hypothetical protein ACH5RR_024636 [Cinchona calisaya]|uniref:Carbohydrate kinase FGGY N-terminal domain-containing protein n=1 Tax=Cinchona calisaya TaxID=153742 RepID=A0ABD2YXA1_9GENT